MYLGKIVEIGPPDVLYAAPGPPVHPGAAVGRARCPTRSPSGSASGSSSRATCRARSTRRPAAASTPAAGCTSDSASPRTAGPIDPPLGASPAERPPGRVPLLRTRRSRPTSAIAHIGESLVRRGTPASALASLTGRERHDPTHRARAVAPRPSPTTAERRPRRPARPTASGSRTRARPTTPTDRLRPVLSAQASSCARRLTRLGASGCAEVAGAQVVARRSSMSGGTASAQMAGSPSCWRSWQRGWKRQPDGGLTGLGTSPLQDDPLAAQLRVGHRDGRHERLRCTGAPGRRNSVAPVGQLGDPAEVHDRDPIADVLDDAHVVGDEHVGQPELALELLEQVEDLRLDRHVERRDRLVADDQVRLEDQRPGDADALALAAARTRAGSAARGTAARPTRSIILRTFSRRSASRAEAVDAQALADAVADRRSAGRGWRTGPGR